MAHIPDAESVDHFRTGNSDVAAFKLKIIAAVAAASASISTVALAAGDRTPTARAISEAIVASPLIPELKPYANGIGRFAAIFAGSEASKARYGAMAMSRPDLASAGSSPAGYVDLDLQKQVDLWAAVANRRFEKLSRVQRRGLSAKGGPYCVFDLDPSCLVRKGEPLARWAHLAESDYFRTNLAKAIETSSLHPVLKVHADEVARLVLDRAGKSKCCTGRMNIHRSDLAARGLTPDELDYMTLEEQVDVWAGIANSRFVTDQVGPIYATPEMLVRLQPGR